MNRLLLALAVFSCIGLTSSQEPVSIQYLKVAHTNPRFLPCLMATANHDGAKVITQDCTASTPAARHWIPVNGNSSTGQGPVTPIKIFGNKCLDVTDGKAKSGTKLQIWTCGKNNANQKWRINGDLTIAWAGKGFCLDLTDGNFANGTRIWTCNPNNINQHWHLIPPA